MDANNKENIHMENNVKHLKTNLSMRDYKRALVARNRCYNFIELRSKCKKRITQQELFEFAGHPLMLGFKSIMRLYTEHPKVRSKNKYNAMDELRNLDPLLLQMCYLENFVNYYLNNRNKSTVDVLEKVLFGGNK